MPLLTYNQPVSLTGHQLMIIDDAYLDDKNFATGLKVVYVRNPAEEFALYTTPIKIE